MQELKPLKLLETETGYKIRQYVKTIDLVELDEPKLTKWQRFKKTFDFNFCYNNLTTRQKRVLHTIAPLWANILQHNLNGDMIVTDDNGKRYNLNAMHGNQCLVGEVYGFSYSTGGCYTCYNHNIDFASLNHKAYRGYYKTQLPQFLDHYYEQHLLPKIELSQHSFSTMSEQ